jgi:hypothetical protein
MSNHLIWRFGEEVYLVFDHSAHDWCGQFKTLDEAEVCAEELEHEPSDSEDDIPISDECLQSIVITVSCN